MATSKLLQELERLLEPMQKAVHDMDEITTRFELAARGQGPALNWDEIQDDVIHARRHVENLRRFLNVAEPHVTSYTTTWTGTALAAFGSQVAENRRRLTSAVAKTRTIFGQLEGALRLAEGFHYDRRTPFVMDWKAT